MTTNGSSRTLVDVDEVLLKVDNAPISEIWDCFVGIIVGDFNKDQTIEQIIGITAVSMIPGVDQVCDIRDIIANIYHLQDGMDNTEHWLNLGLTLAGLVPTLGSFGKGGTKVALHYAKKSGKNAIGAITTGSKAAIEKAFGSHLDDGVRGLHSFTQHPTVDGLLTSWKIYEPLPELSKQFEALGKKVSAKELFEILEKLVKQIKGLYDSLPGLVKYADFWGVMDDFFILCNKIISVAEKKLEGVINGIKELILLLAEKLKSIGKTTGDGVADTKATHKLGDNNKGKKSGKNKDEDPKKIAKETPKRPSWKQSETDVEKSNPTYKPQKSFKDGKEVPYGTKGSTRPELHKPGHSIEVKNYNIETPSGQSNLVNNVSTQIKSRVSNLPSGTKQTIVIDVRGQNVTNEVLKSIRHRILEKSNVKVEIIFKR